tara:strand:- start:461 stop:1333 length:873 start_codon:yes stop_codon:yes gene_type:complete
MSYISIIASYRNEEESLKKFISTISKSFKNKQIKNYEIIFVDDCSTDNSLNILLKEAKKNKKIKIIKMKRRYGHSNSIQAAFENISKNNFSVIIDCDLQDSPELISKNFNPNEKDRTIHFVRTERKDGFFQKIYSNIAYKILYLISFGKIISNAGYFKINPPSVTKKIKKDKEYYPYWNYLITKYSKKNKKIFYSRLKRSKGTSKFSFMSLNPWLTFFGGAYYFKINYIIFLSLIILLIDALKKDNYFSKFEFALNSGLILIIINLITFLLYLVFKNKKKIKCKYTKINF